MKAKIGGFLIAAAVLGTAVAALPTSALIYWHDLSVSWPRMQIIRTVLFPLSADSSVEVEDRTAFEGVAKCNSGYLRIPFEARGEEPQNFTISCDLPPGSYRLRVCFSARLFDVPRSPTCRTADFKVER